MHTRHENLTLVGGLLGSTKGTDVEREREGEGSTPKRSALSRSLQAHPRTYARTRLHSHVCVRALRRETWARAESEQVAASCSKSHRSKLETVRVLRRAWCFGSIRAARSRESVFGVMDAEGK